MRCTMLLILCTQLHGAEINGLWRGERKVAPDRTEPITFRFAANGEKIEGSVRTGFGEIPIEGGTWNGREFRFMVNMTFPPHRVEDEYRGQVDGVELQFSAVRDGRASRSGTARRESPDPEPFVRMLPRATPPREPLPPNGLALTPPMGWSSWNRFADKIDAQVIREIADAMVASGLREAGYVYVNIDDGWQGVRDSSGVLQPNAGFKDMKELGDYLHARGLKFGIYSSPGPRTCAGYEGSWGREAQDAAAFAAWGVDYLKYDWCSAGLVWDLPRMGDAYALMARSLRSTARPVAYSICQYGLFEVWTWGAAAGGNLWRTTGDIGNSWASIASIAFEQAGLDRFAEPGHWNDPDMLEIGNGALTVEEERSHFTLWAVLAAPLMLGNDVRQMRPETREILINREVIAINQDPLGRQARRVRQDPDGQVWTKELQNGDLAVALFNPGAKVTSIDVIWKELGLKGSPRVRDLWQAKDLGPVHGGFARKLEPHSCALFRVKPDQR